MDVILIPGFWLDSSAWDEVVPAVGAAGHEPRPITLPGLAPADPSVGLRDQADYVVGLVDAAVGPVVLVGHSGGGAVAHAVVDARPDRIAKVIYVDSGPLGDGGMINDEFTAVDGMVPLPPRDEFDAESVVDMDDERWAAFAARALPIPEKVATEKQVLGDPRRYDVPVTVITCEMSEATLRDLIAKGHPYVRELAAVKHYEIVELRTGHWPMLSKPAELAALVAAALPPTG
ncbi:alpha/beta fold hydrolase [Pseudolysinimonas yzui]|uniref:Esterase n=1 Tax=Pseudolysinimonas yzui TaxID=2708254 RepID=A0A8J3M3Z3_9MICO|nr:alpha/beta hydrolase [Pseudolysinimonas yzui]GHF24910.1 esterase [Pseudolysinimonas yzui]